MSAAYERVLDALTHVGMKTMTKGDKARAQCPAHGSRGLTLSVQHADDKAVVKCFAGCELDEILDALGLVVVDLFDGDRPAGYRPPPRPKPTPWDPFVRAGLEHVLGRMVTEQAIEADPSLRTHARALHAADVVIR